MEVNADESFFMSDSLGATSTGPLIAFMMLFGIAQGAYISCSASTFMALSEDMSEIG
jgi:hypothetical protein